MKTFFELRESVSERVIDAKKMDAYKKFAKANKVDDDSVRMACDNPNHAETKRMMKNKTFAKAVQMYKSAKKESVEEAKDEFKPHKMYDPETGKAYDADTEADHLRMKKLGYTHEKPEVKEDFSPKEIKMAIGIASDPRYKGGNMTGAVRAIDKIKKGLSGHKQVMAVLKRQNEDIEEAMTPKEKAAHAKALADFKKRGGKIKKLKPGYAQGWTGKDDFGTGQKGMLSKSDTSKFGTKKRVKSMRAHVESTNLDEKVYSKPAKLDPAIAKDPKVKAAQKAHAKGDWDGNVDKEGNAVVHVKGKPHTVTVQI